MFSGNTATLKTKANPKPQVDSLVLSQTRFDLPNGGRMLTLTGQYQVGNQAVKLRASNVAGNVVDMTGPPIAASSEAFEEEWKPEEDYYYSDSAMDRSDGSPLMRATYEYQEAAQRSTLYITLGSVNLVFDLDTDEAGPITAVDEDRLNEWLTSEDGRLVRDTSIAIIQQADQQTYPELLLNYYAVAMLVDNDPPAESAIKIMKKTSMRAHHAIFGPARSTLNNCLVSKNAFTQSLFVNRYTNLLTLGRPPQGNCFGCCGVGCACIPNPFGGAMYSTPCANHDRCTRDAGSRFAGRCTGALIIAIVYVWATYKQAYHM
ncbi:MAG TPA: hypothetical protein DC047_20695 [Blastocatellia bacterium]|nr:hypothetical protein [Blastocatellia bacterium]